MKIILLSEMSVVKDRVTAALGDLASGRVLIIDSAAPGVDTPEKPRGGTAVAAYRDRGASVRVADYAETGPIDLSDYDVVHFTGGDPFRLLVACQSVGFAEAAAERAADGDFAVVGSSAGAMVMGRYVGHAAILCDPFGIESLDGFGWVDGLVMPHMDAEGRTGDVIRNHVHRNPGRDWVELNDHDVMVREIDLSAEASLQPA